MAGNNTVEIEIKANTSGAASEITKLGESANFALLAADKLGLGFNTAMQKAQAGAEELNRSLGGIAGNSSAISAVISTQNKFIELGQAAGVAGDKIAEMYAKFGSQIGASAATTSIEHARTQLMSMGVSAGFSASALHEMGASIGMTAKETEEHTRHISGSLARMAEAVGMSMAQLQNGMRMIPMQMTDIVTSLASGMPPWMVLIQQGGQLKDTLGGTSMALRAVATYVVGLINPFTVAAATVGVLALAYAQGSKEADAYRLALVNTGNAAGVTTGQMAGMAQHVGDTVGTTGAAAEALTALAATGSVAGANMEKFATAAIYAQKGLGQEVGETAKVFESLAKSPAEASAKLNEKLNYLTASTFAQIKAAQDLGDKETAASIAQNAYSDAIEARGRKMIAAMGLLERGWMGVAGAAKWAWDAMLDIGREEDPTAKAAAAAVKLLGLRAKLQSGNFGIVDDKSARAAIQLQIAEQEKILSLTQKKTAADNAAAKAQAENAELDQKRIDWTKKAEGFLSPEARALKEAAKIREEGIASGASQKEINMGVSLVLQPLAAQGLQRQMEQLKEYQAEIVDGEKLTQAALAAEHSAGLIESVAYFQQKKQLTLNANTDQQAVLDLEIEATKKSGIAQAEKASKLAGLTAEMNKLERERVAITQQAEIDIAAERRKGTQALATESISIKTAELELWYKLALVKDADYYQNASQNTAKYQQEKANLALETYLNESRYAVQGSQVEIDARQKMINVVRDIGLERELANKNATASAYEYGRTVDLALEKQAYESSLILQTGEERTKLLAIYDIEASKLEKIRQIMATTPEGKERDKSIADIELTAAKAKQGEVSKALNAEWKTHLDFAEGVAKGIWDDYPSGAAQAAQNALGKVKKELFDEIYKLMLKPLFIDVYANVMGQPTGAAGGGVGGLLQQASGINNLVSGGGSAGMLASAGYGAALGTTSIGAGSQAAMLAAQTADFGFAGAALTAEAAGATTAMSGLAGSIGALSAAAPWIAGGLMIANAVGLFGGDNNSKVGGTYQYTQGAGIDVWRNEAGKTRLGTDGVEIGDNLIQKGIQSAADNINKILEQIGSTSRVKSLTAGAQSASEKPEAMVEAYGTLDTGRKFGFQGEQKLNKTASPEEVIKEYQTALNQATLEAIKQAAEIPKSVKDMLQKVDPRGIENDKFNEYLSRIVSDAQAAITQQWTGMDVSAFGDLIVGMADTSVSAAEYMSSGISDSIGAAWAGSIQEQFNNAMFTGVLQPIIMTATTAGMSSDLIKEQLGAAQTAIANMRSQLSTMKEIMGGDDFKGLMKDIGEAFSGAQAPIKELQTYVPETSKSVKKLSDTASSASKDIADSAKKEADERKGLQDKLDALTMTRAQLLAKERDAISESNRALFDQLKAREAFSAANEKSKAELEKQASFAIDLIAARGDAEVALEARRAAAIRTATDGMESANAELVAGAMMATNAMEDQVSATSALRDAMVSLGDKSKDLQVKLLEGRGDATGAKELSRAAELDALTKGKDAAARKEIEAAFAKNAKLEDQIALESKLSSAMQDVSKLQKANAADAIKLQKDVAKEQADAAKAVMDTVRAARLELIGETDAGAKMQADAAREFIRSAGETARKTGYLPDEKKLGEALAALKSDTTDYTTAADAVYSKMLVAGDLAGLEDASKTTLDKANAAQKTAEAQLLALEGSNATALQAAQAAQSDAARQLTELVGIREALAAQKAIAASMDKAATGGSSTGVPYRAAPVEFNAGLRNAATEKYKYYADTIGLAAGADKMLGDIKGYGYTMPEAEAILGFDAGTLTDFAASIGIPAFATGANVVPQDMLALVHKDEAIIPAPFNPYLRGGETKNTNAQENNNVNNSEIIAELRAMRAELTRVKDLLDRVTEGGNAMLTTTA